MAYFPAADFRNSLTIVSVCAPVAALALLGTVPDPTSRTSTTPFFAAGGADRRRDGRFLFGGGRRAALGGGALVGLGARRAVGVDEGVLLGALAHGAFAHNCVIIGAAPQFSRQRSVFATTRRQRGRGGPQCLLRGLRQRCNCGAANARLARPPPRCDSLSASDCRLASWATLDDQLGSFEESVERWEELARVRG